uniref:DNA2/NAM7 helicase-like C-terminal domain-containing protein n=1 Tax=Phaseolus vulgaris TaxID=3885 RepID=V7CP54_PHAVU|nr:hypothetical protein PHAVU_002G203200g [Phaseolus vulgaris]ESW31030.1 hypothetical protein PHAVU_002G203200g [Phaseolus vulgaris]
MAKPLDYLWVIVKHILWYFKGPFVPWTTFSGPPGTGKTQTILGILSTILHATPTRVHSKTYELRQGPQLPTQEKQRHWGLASPGLSSVNPRDSLMPKDGDKGFTQLLKMNYCKYRVGVLVCTPSNSAFDEIVLRIRSFPSREFYRDSLQDGDELKSRTIRAWHDYHCFGPFRFFDIHEGKEARPSGSGSWINVEEVDFVLFLLVNQVAILSPYSQQVKLFQKRFEETFGMSAEKVVDICTVDGCQDIAILSCVWASKDKGIGFVEDIRRLNVGITRAKSGVLVLCGWIGDESLSSIQTKVAEPSQVIGPDTVDNDVQPNNAATFDDQAQAEDNDEMMTTWT